MWKTTRKRILAGMCMSLIGASVHVDAATYNVADFGADGTGVNSDRRAIQAALDKAKGAPDATVVMVPAGTYYLDRSLFIYSNTRLSLDEGAKFIRSESQDRIMLLARHVLESGEECPGDETCRHGGHTQFSNITVDGGTWDAASSDQEITGVFRLSHGAGLTIENVRVQGCTDHMLNISGSSDVVVSNCVFTAPVRYSGTDPAAWLPYDVGDTNRFNTIESIHMDFTDEEGEAGNYPHDGTACERVTVVGCVFDGVFAGVGNHHAAHDRFSSDLAVQDCIFTNLQAYAVDCFGLTNCVIARCTSVGGLGLVRSSQAQFSATSNTVESAGEHAFFLVHGTNARLTENIVVGSIQGVNLVGAGAELRGNRLSGCGDCGVRADEASAIVSSGNDIVAPLGHGFGLTGNSSLQSESDTVSSSGGSGFVVAGGGVVSITGAEVVSPSSVGIQLDGVESGEIRADAIRSAGSHGIVLNGCRSSTVCDNAISDPGGHGIVVGGSGVQLSDNEIRNAGGCGIRADSGSSVVSSGNTIISPASHGFAFTGSSSLQSGSDTVSSPGGSGFVVAGGGDVSIAGAEVASPSAVGIQLDYVEFGEITADAIRSAGSHGIVLNGCQSSMVCDNAISGSGGSGVVVVGGSADLQRNAISASGGNGVSTESQAQLVASGNTVSGGQYGFCVKSGCSLFANGNKIDGSSLSAVYAVGARAVTCTGNEIAAPGNSGFYMHQTTGAAIKGNSVQGSGWPGVWIRESPVCEVSGNTIADSAQEGIYCTASAQCVVSSNLVAGATKIGIRVDGTGSNPASAKILDNDVTSLSESGDIRVCAEASGYEVAGNVCRGVGFTMEYAVLDVTEYHPADAQITSVALTSADTAEVKWENQIGVTGYFVEYSPSADFPEGATGRSENIVDGSGCFDIAGLASGDTWYVRVRTYHAYFGAMYESPGDPAFCETVSMSEIPDVFYHFVTFDANGGEGGWSRLLAFGEKLDPPLPQREGYDFSNWFPEVPERAGAVDVTYTAQWKAIDGSGQGPDSQRQVYTVTFDANGGEGGWSRQLFFDEELDPPLPQREGCDFVGWFPEVPERAGAVDVTYTAQWKVNQYTVTFDANGGEGGVEVTQDYGTGLEAPTVTREGFTFAGWSPEVPATVPATNAVYTAQWEVNRYTSTFDANGGEGGVAVTQDYGTELAAPAVTREGYAFAGWSPEVPATVPATDALYTAQWEVNRYTSTFDANGGEGGTAVTQDYGTELAAPTVARTGYVFVGWSPEVPATVPAADATYVAQWAKTQSKATFGKNGGTGGDNYVTATYGKAMPTPRVAPKQSGWTFAGYWDTLACDEKGSAKGKKYYDGNMKSARSWDKKGATTLWAKWTNKVTFGKNGGTGGDSYVTCTKGQPMPKRTMPKRTGYTFAGYWNTTGAGGVKYYNADGTSAHAWDRPGNVTLWAKWEKVVSVKVTLGKNGGTGGDNYVTCTLGKPMPTPRTAPKLSGWTFAGYWDTLAVDEKGNAKGKQYYDKDMKSVRNWDKTAATTLWAKWTVRVKLGKNGGTGGDNYVTVIKGRSFPKRTMPTKSGYKFCGYYVSASKRTGQCYNADGTGTASMKWSTGGSPTIWALWIKTSSSVEVTPPIAAPVSAAPAAAEPAALAAGLYSGVLADGSGTFWLMLDDAEDGLDRTAYLYIASEDGAFSAECTAEEAGSALILTTEDGALYVFDPVAGLLADAAVCPNDGI